MKRFSIELRVTLWFTGALLLLAAVALAAVLPVSETVRKSAARQRLLTLVELNADEVKFQQGILDIDEGFILYSDGVYLTAYAEDRALLAGELPPGLRLEEPFENGVLREFLWQGEKFFCYDRLVDYPDLPNIWVRGLVKEEDSAGAAGILLRAALMALPGLALLSALGGYVLTRRALRPLERLRRAADEVSGSADLRRRIDLGPGQDEIHRLADTMNAMLARLEASFEAEQQFVADASHELRTPTAVILAQTEYAMSEPLQQGEALESIHRQALKMQRLVQSLLLLTRLERGMDRLPMEPFDFSALLEELCEDFALTLDRGITLETSITPGLAVTGNRELLSRLTLNLLSNAARYGRPQGHIWLRLAQEEGGVLLEVEDDGIGIAPEHLAKIWQRFYQADASRSQGTGLGLSMVQGIARLHGGQVTCRSQVGQGSGFAFRL